MEKEGKGVYMKKSAVFILFISFLFLCSCGKKESYADVEFPGTTWQMNIREVIDALDLKEKDIGYTYVDPYGTNSKLYMEGYELFGAKTKSIDLQFLDFENLLEREPIVQHTEDLKLLDQVQHSLNERFLNLVDRHELAEILVTYPADTDMEIVLQEMKKEYGDPLSEITMYEFNSGSLDSPKPKEYKDSEQVKFWGSDYLASSIPKNESEAYRQGWKKYDTFPGMVDAQNGVSWDTFTKTAHMHTVLFQNEKDCKQLLFFAIHAGVYRTLHQQIMGQNQ